MARAAAKRQMSRKSGLVSTAQKMDGARHGFGTQPAARKAAGAFGSEDRAPRRQSGTATSKPGRAAALRGMKTAATRRRKAAKGGTK